MYMCEALSAARVLLESDEEITTHVHIHACDTCVGRGVFLCEMR